MAWMLWVSPSVCPPDCEVGSSAFKRDDKTLEAKPIDVVVFPGNGIIENLADKVCRQGNPTLRSNAYWPFPQWGSHFPIR